MIGKKIEKAINEQINREIYSAYLYLAMSMHSANEGLQGIAKWLRVQYQEEMSHALKFMDYMNEQGARVELKAIETPPAKFASPLAIFERTLEHEQFVTKNIHALLDLAIQEKDHATAVLLHWYVNEQVEEESNARDIVDKMKKIGDSAQGLFMIDALLGKRGGE